MQGIVWEGDGEGGGWERGAARGRRAEALGASRGRRAEVGDQSESEEGGGTGGPVAASARPPTTGRRCAMRGGHKAQTAPTERRHSTGSGHAALQRSGVWVERRGLRGPAKKCGSSRSHIHGLIHSASGIRHSAFPPYMAWRMNTTPTAWSPRRPPSSACGRDRRSGFPFARGFLNGRKTACPSGRTIPRGS